MVVAVSTTRQPRNHVRMITYNIIAGGGSRINMALRAMAAMHVDLGIFTETKLTNEMYTHDCLGYSILATKAASSSLGGVALFYRQQSIGWSVEGPQTHGPNVVSCKLIAGDVCWNVIGVYIPPSEDSGVTLHFIEEAVRAHIGYPIILLGDINVDFNRINTNRAEDIATAIAQHGLRDVGDYFLHPRGRWTYSQYQNANWIQSTTDCLLSERPSLFRRWTIKIP
jgi:exonuclease III